MPKLLLIAAFLFFTSAESLSQQTATQQYRIGVDVYSGTKPSCPVFIGRVLRDSPAAKAELQPGDQMIAVDGAEITDVQMASQHLSSAKAKPVTLTLRRDDKPLTVTVQREENVTLLRNDGWKILPDGSTVKADATDAEIKYLLDEKAFMGAIFGSPDHAYAVAFPDKHYPLNKELYYPGFEVFILEKGNHIVVGGIEDGPASRAGIRWGDRIVAVNSVDPQGRSTAEIESLLSSTKPASII